jgi:hypothetical protein
MQHSDSNRDRNRATFVEVFGSIKFSGNSAANNGRHQWPEPGFAVNESTRLGEAAPDDSEQLVRSSN